MTGVELDEVRPAPVVLVRTVRTEREHAIVYAVRVEGGTPNATHLLDAWGDAQILLMKRVALAEARERWGAPRRVRFELVDRRSRRQARRRKASTRVD